MDHEIQVALISLASGVLIALIAAFSAMMLARNTSKLAAHKRELEELARKTARKTEVQMLKLQIDQLQKENARLRRRITSLDKLLKDRNADGTD